MRRHRTTARGTVLSLLLAGLLAAAASPSASGTEQGVEAGEGAMPRRGEKVGEHHRFGQAEVSLPVGGPRPAVVAAIGVAEEEPGELCRLGFGGGLGEEVGRPPLGSEEPGIAPVLTRHHEDAPAHGRSRARPRVAAHLERADASARGMSPGLSPPHQGDARGSARGAPATRLSPPHQGDA